MTMMAVLTEARTADRAATMQSRIARVEVIRDLAAAEPMWRALEQSGGHCSPYQRFDLLSAWQRHVGSAERIEPFVAVARDADDRPLLVLPLGVERKFGVRVASFLGGKHTTFNMPLWRRDFALTADALDLDALLGGLRDAGGADVLALMQQPLRWNDLANPLAQLPSQPSVNDCPVLLLPAGAAPNDLVSNSMRRRLKGKERKLQELAGYRYGQAQTQADVDRLLDAFFRIKPVRMAAQNLPDVFADPGVADFIRQACATELKGGGRAIEIHALECDDEMIAMYAGVADGSRYSMMFNTYTLSDAARHSPGLILMRHIIDHYAARGYRFIDLGIGSDDYKKMFCKDLEPIFDSYVALSPRGRLAAAALAAVGRGKHMVKHSPATMQLVRRLRGALPR
ncbi:GNAT family N-acetyltransferase [Rhodopseudomonas palustris]|uniref:GNAT family N-acetyltransferase n=1 Tax=Rhodopseudomonas palustris TaxID=1076 RepID=A0A323UW84_RHOPL|nr:GNAT family N-acetyltransferase [Rhodopseudomonas palustris]PZA11938.1 GNAT family N-acetyltransferase [Rhodopseudomonas palustris]